MTASFPAVFAAAQEMERRRIAGDLHDSIGQSLSAVCFGLGAAVEIVRKGNVRDAGRLLERLAAQVEQAIDEVRRIALDLTPAALEDAGLVGTLSQLLREFRSMHGGLAVVDELGIDESRIPPGLRAEIYRLVQEAMANVARHASATRILVALRHEAGEIRLEVSDDGVGFTPAVDDAPRRRGLGLNGMRERARRTGGNLGIDSAPGCGTRIVAAWPALSDRDAPEA